MEATFEAAGVVQFDPLYEMKEKSMPHPQKGKIEEQDDKVAISGEDVVQIEALDKEAISSDVVLTSIHKLKKKFSLH